MHHALLSVLFVFSFLSINAKDFSLRGGTFIVMKGMDALPQQSSKLPQAASDPPRNSSNPPAQGPTTTVPVSTSDHPVAPPVPGPNQSVNGTAVPAASPANNTQNAAPSSPPTVSIPAVPAPEQIANSTCRNASTGKNVTFSDRACWYAAKSLAEAGSSYAQCGTCVLGLFDAEKKAAFKPTSPIAPSIVQEQVMKLLQQCKSNAPKLPKRDTAPKPPSNDTANVQLLMGFNEKPKECPGL